MNKNVLKILIAISVIILVLGFFSGKGLSDEIKSESMPTQSIYVDETDTTAITKAFIELGSGLLGFVVIVYSVLLVACIWAIYLIILLIKSVAKKIQRKTNIK